MSATTTPRSTRDRPAKAPLSVDAIVDAAIAILETDGLDAMTMRRVAAALDTGAGSLYVYFTGREDLLAAVFDRVITQVELEPPHASRWREQLHQLLERMRNALVAHPGLAAATMVDPPRSEGTLGLLENLLGLLFAGGLSAQDAAWTADLLAAQVTFAAIEAELRRANPDALADQVTANFARLPPDRFPLITSHIAELVAGNVDVRFHFGIDAVLDGTRRVSAPPAT